MIRACLDCGVDISGRGPSAVRCAPHAHIEKKKKRKSYILKWNLANPEKKRGYVNKWKTANPERVKTARRRWQALNLERVRSQHRKWCEANREKRCASNRKHYAGNAKKLIKGARKWAVANRGAYNANTAKRKAAKIRATPVWADLKTIQSIYVKAQIKGMTVDHIIPLQGRNVCGLHVENNLQLLTKSENSRKGNRF